MTQPTPTPQRTAMRANVLILLFWLVAGAALYGVFHYLEQRERAAFQPYTLQDGALVLPRGRDGHFYVDGEVNRQAVRFMVDTGASNVAITKALAQRAGLPEGLRTVVETANGPRAARLVRGVPVRAGHLAVNATNVTVGLSTSGDGADALLGQSFLRHFDVEMKEKTMVLRPRAGGAEGVGGAAADTR